MNATDPADALLAPAHDAHETARAAILAAIRNEAERQRDARTERDAAITEARELGAPWHAIAAASGLSIGGCQRIAGVRKSG